MGVRQVRLLLGLALVAVTFADALAGETGVGAAPGSPTPSLGPPSLGPPLQWQDAGGRRDLPLLDPEFRTGLAGEPLRLYRHSPTLALAVGRGIVFKTRSGASRDQVHRQFPGLQALSTLAELGEERIFRGEAVDVDALAPMLARLRGDAMVVWAQPDVLKVEHGGAPERLIQPTYDLAGYSLRQDLQLDEAWRIATGKGVRVAIIDAGMDLSHPALAGVAVPFAYDTESRSADVSPRRKGDRHGDMVAGLVFANGIEGEQRGIAPDAALIAIRLTSTWTSDIVLAFQAAYLAGADVINCSWDDPLVLQPVVEVVQQIERKGRDGRGALIVVAAGNRALDTSSRPSLANRVEVIAVTALDHANRPIAAFGHGIDIAAPSMLPTLGAHTNSKPAYLGKTSAAAPVVSATLALMLSADPLLTADAARSGLLSTATELADASGLAPGVGKVAPLAAVRWAASDRSATP
jgi:hypothetical protein